jgi:hypothetical protein
MVSVNHHDDVGTVENRAGVTALLVRAVAAVGGVAEDFKAFGECDRDRVIAAGVVNQQCAVKRFDWQVGGDAFDRLRSVVSREYDVDLVRAAAFASQSRVWLADLLIDGKHYALIAKR